MIRLMYDGREETIEQINDLAIKLHYRINVSPVNEYGMYDWVELVNRQHKSYEIAKLTAEVYVYLEINDKIKVNNSFVPLKVGKINEEKRIAAHR